MDSSNTMTVAIPEDQADQVDAWTDGQSYQITVQQTGPGQFQLVSIDGQPDTDDNQQPETNAAMPGSAADVGGTTIPSKNPAITNLMAQKGLTSGYAPQ